MVDDSRRSDSDAAERASALLAALARYRDRRALDGGDERSAVECLIEGVTDAEEMAAHHRRRIELVERAVEEEGLDREMAEEVYDIAREEGLEPAFAFELVRCGVAVCEPEEQEEPIATTSIKGQPEWLEAPVPTEEATRERRLRMSFRRLRHLLEERPTAEDALIAFAQEPDVRRCGY